MNSRARILKDVRVVFWPWLAAMVAAILPALNRSDGLWVVRTSDIAFTSLVIGMPVLAMLPFAHEFQHRTMPLLLSQPVARMRIWAEKISVSVLAVLSAAIVFYLMAPIAPRARLVLGFACWVLVTTCAAPLWVLVVRAAVGGLVFNIAFQGLFMSGAIFYFETKTASPGHETTAVAVLSIAALSYAAVMLELGRRQFVGFQMKDAIAGGDALMSATNILPRPLASLLRSRATSPTLNLIRKEINLFRPFWVLAGLMAIGLAVLALFNWTSLSSTKFSIASEFASWPTFLAAVGLFVFWLIATLLSGAISIAEEKASGTQSWHATLPVSTVQQWAIKLAFGIIANFVTLAALINFGRWILGAGFDHDVEKMLPGSDVYSLFLMSLLSFPAFWCASLFKGATRAALFVLPVWGFVAVATAVGTNINVGRQLVDFLIMTVHPFPFTSRQMFLLGDIRRFWIWGPTFGFALLQTYRLFRTEIRESLRSVMPYFLALFGVALLAGASYGFSDKMVHTIPLQISSTLFQTRNAIGKMKIDYTKLDAAHPLEIRLEDMHAVANLSSTALDWLSKARITIAPPHTNFTWLRLQGKSALPYFTTIHLAHGWQCTIYDRNNWHCKAPDGDWFGLAPTW